MSEKAGTAANVEDENSWCKEVVERGRGRSSGNGEQSGSVGWMVGRQKIQPQTGQPINGRRSNQKVVKVTDDAAARNGSTTIRTGDLLILIRSCFFTERSLRVIISDPALQIRRAGPPQKM